MKIKNSNLNKNVNSAREKRDGRDTYRRSIFSVIYIFLGLFVLVMGYFAYFLVFKSTDIVNSNYNHREEILTERVIRGEILAADHTVLAQTNIAEDGSETRVYPYGDMYAHVVGRTSKGMTGVEESENIQLLTSNMNSFGNMYNDLMGQKNVGDNVVTTLDVNLQKTAYDALGDNRGAIVVMDPSTGKILAMVSKPSYDPNQIDQIWNDIVKDEDTESPLINRATQGLYPPGSTFKILTTLAFMRQNPNYADYSYKCNGSIEYDDLTIHDYKGESHGRVDLKASFAESCNASFANLSENLDMDKFRAVTEDFLYNKSLPVDMVSNPSSFVLKKGEYGVKDEMQTAIGQGKTLVTPLLNAMIAATVANGGVMMKPYVVDHIESAGGSTIRSYHPDKIAAPMTLSESDYLTKLMRAVVTDGTADELKDLSVKAAGKTGSADTGNDKPAHAWFVGFAPYNNPKLLVSIIVENKGTGSEYAVPIARKIFDAYFNK